MSILSEIRCPSCNRMAGMTDDKSFVKITCQRCSKEFTITKGVYKVLEPSSQKQREKQLRWDMKRKMAETSYQTRLGIRKK